MDTIDPQAAPAPAAPAATEAMLDDEDDDASGPSILLRAAAEMIVDEAERDSHIDAAEALLRLIPTVDLETMYDFLSPCSWSGASRRHSRWCRPPFVVKVCSRAVKPMCHEACKRNIDATRSDGLSFARMAST